jgi:hypothetical protein
VTKVSYEVSGGPLELERPGHRNGHRHALWLAGSVEHHHRAQRHLHAPERGLVRGWSRRYESRDLRHCCQLIESSRIWIKSEWGLPEPEDHPARLIRCPQLEDSSHGLAPPADSLLHASRTPP